MLLNNEVNMATARLYIAKAPTFSSFEAYTADMEVPKPAKGPIVQALKAKCRELARSDSGLLVSPTSEALNTRYGLAPKLTLWIVVKVGYIKNAKTSAKLNQLEIKVSRQVAFSLNILQSCYHFTLIARLAPKWNKVTNWLLQGSEFLTEGRAQALDLQIGLSTNDITLNLTVYKLSLSPMKVTTSQCWYNNQYVGLKPSSKMYNVEDLLITSTLLNRFRQDHQYVIQEGSIYNNKCLLLPNFTTGYIYSASHHLPHGEEFQSYDQVRLHWKKQHGIILPERQDLFYQVFFRGNPGKFFSYPGSCVFKSKPIPYPSKDTEMVANSFITDVHARLPTMCGEQVRYSSSALTPTASLQEATCHNTHQMGQSYSNLKRLPNSSNYKANLSSLPRTLPKTSFSISTQVVPNVMSHVNSDHLDDRVTSGPRVVPTFKSKAVSSRFTNTAAVQHPKPQPPIVPRFKTTTPGVSSSKTLGKRPPSTCMSNTSTLPATKILCTDGTNYVPTTSEIRKQQSTSKGQNKAVTDLVRSHALSSCNQTVPDMNTSISSHLNDFDVSMTTVSISKHSDTQPGKLDVAKSQDKVQGSRKQQPASKGYDVTGVGADVLRKITKAKAAVLKKWLGDNGVKCRSKEKKDDLVKMVAQHIKSTGKSFEIVGQ